VWVKRDRMEEERGEKKGRGERRRYGGSGVE
jgi:hypothetical protein